MPPLPKDPAIRQRANRRSTRATLPGGRPRKALPALPDVRDWQALTRDWWRDVWASPMAAQYLDADVHGLCVLAVLVDRFWLTPTTALAAEIRQQRAPYGLTPIDRRRLEWTVDHASSPEAPEAPEAPRRVTSARAALRALG